ncbi:hypothetical protein TRVA0_005S04104 [Trichomonascus vanleenenianus]|uniref:decapping enzyme complex catalytic subunit n=1 Tax=Trichomonascus vanleenenianus TaxID=2268995 RepID=UPI003ECB46C5
MSLATVGSYKDEPLVNALQDLAVRFIINCPAEDLESSERLFFQIEEAQWFYEDFVRVENPSLPSMKLKTFVERLFQACPILEVFSADTYTDLAKFQSYKSIIPVRGAIILNKKMTKALMVKGWKQGASWGFPRGKINKDERDDLCAIREVYEEIGYDISPFLAEQDYIEVTIRQKNIRLYIIRGVPSNTAFKPQTRKEISKIEWHDVNKLPAYSRNPKNNSQWEYFMVAPFMPGLSKYIKKARGEKSSLSKKEAKALKSLLGVSGAEAKAEARQAPVTAEITDASAEELLRLIKSGGGKDEKQAGKEDRKILLDLINEKKEGADEMSNARELLSMLQTEMQHDMPMVQPPPVPPMPMGQWPNGIVPPPLPPPPMGLPLGMPPIPPPGMPWGIPPPPPPPPGTRWPMAPPPIPPIPPIPPPQPQNQHSHASTVNVVSEDGRDSLISYNAPPPPPPNPVLMSLLQKRKTTGSKPNGGGNSEKAVDHRFESYRSLKNKTTDFGEVSGGKSALLSLLGGDSKLAESNDTGKDDLMKLLKGGGDKPENELMNLLKGNTPKTARSDEQTDSNALMSLLKGAQPKEEETTAHLMKLLRGDVRPPQEKRTTESAQVSSDSSKDLMNLLRKSPPAVEPSKPEPTSSSSSSGNELTNLPNGKPASHSSESSSAKTDLMSLLNPGKEKRGDLLKLVKGGEKPNDKTSEDEEDLMKLLLSGRKGMEGAAGAIPQVGHAKGKETHKSLPIQRRSSAGAALMDLLNPRGNASHRAEESKFGEAKPASANNNTAPASSNELMNLLNGGSHPSSPKLMQERTVAELLPAANGEPLHYRQDRAPSSSQSQSQSLSLSQNQSQSQSQRAVDLMGLLNGGSSGDNSSSSAAATLTSTTSPALPSVGATSGSGKRNSSGAQSLMALLNPTSASSASKSSVMSSSAAVGNTDTSSHAVHIPKEEKRSAEPQTKQGAADLTVPGGSTDAEENPMAKFLRDFSSGRI